MPSYISIPCTGGVNLLDDPRRIRDDELVRAKNLVPFTKGMLQKRPGAKAIPYTDSLALYGNIVSPDGISKALINPVPGISSAAIGFTNSSNQLPGLRGVITSTALSVSAALFNFNNGNGPLIENPIANLFVFAGKLYALPGADTISQGYEITSEWFDPIAPFVVVHVTPNFTWGGTGNNFMPNVVCTYRRRGILCHLGAGYENYVVFTDPDDLATIGDDVRSANGRAFSIGARDADKIIAATEITHSEVGSPAESSLLILKEKSAYIITGEPNLTTDTGDMLANLIVNKISYACGCGSANTVVNTPYGVIWAGPDDVWFFATGSLPKRIGTKLRPRLEATPSTARHRWHAAYHNGFYRLALYSPGADMSYIGSPDEQWWLDLRNGPPQGHEDAQWWGPQMYNFVGFNQETTPPYLVNHAGTDCMFQAEINGTLKLLGTSYGYVVDFDTQDGRDILESSTGATQDGVTPGVNDVVDHDSASTEIEFELVTKEYDFGAPMQQKGFLNLQADYWTNITSYLKCQVLADGGATTDSSSALVEQDGLMPNADTFGGDNLLRQFRETVLYPSDRLTGKTFQFRIYDEAEYTIGVQNDVLLLLSGGTYYEVSLTDGIYADLKELLDHVAARVLAVTGISCSHDVAGAASRNATITLTFGSAVSICFQTAGTASALSPRKTRALLGMLGWDTSADTSANTAQVSSTTVYFKSASSWRFGAFEVEIDLFGRRPA